LSEAVLYYPGHPLTPFAYLELGNLEAKTGKLDEALAWYSRLAREWPHTPLLIEAHFNRGLIQRRAGENAAARQSFYRVVDRAPGHELAQLAYNHIGRLHLEDDEPDKALSPLRRALVASRDVPVQPSVALTLACAYLLGNNPRAANRVLVENRALVSQLEYRRAAAFLDTLARYRACTDRKLKQRESADLLTCLLTLHDENFLGPPGLLLLAQSYRDLGMNDRLIAFATKALPRLRGPLAIEMSATLADAYYATDKQAQAAALYARVAAGRGPQAVPARLRLAEIALKSKNSNECLKWCRRLLQEPGTTDAGVILRLMAGAYELAGERDKAIRCLSGKVPP
jgi:tetratricopeptide (TPR) repeat protein